MEPIRWADDDDDDYSVTSVHSDVAEQLVPGSGHMYSMPISIGDITIMTQGDFAYHMQSVYEVFSIVMDGPAGEALWAEIARDMMDTSNPDNMDAAGFELLMMLADVDLEAIAATMESLKPIDISEVQKAITADSTDQLAAAVKELTLDVFDQTPDMTSFTAPSHTPMINRLDGLKPSGTGPPLCPDNLTGKACYLRLCHQKKTHLSLFEGRCEWATALKTALPNFPSDRIETYSDEESAVSSRSNLRPKGRAAVMIIFDDNTQINVGSHGYSLSRDIDFALDFSGMENALVELFSAPGGEGLTCPTPSHILHQMVSAVMGAALDTYGPIIEADNVDLCLDKPLCRDLSKVCIDFTTSAGIWNKKLSPDMENPNFRYQAAVSKYDVASVLIHECDGEVKILIARAVANCLSCEYPAFFRLDEQNVPEDLRIQSQIYSMLSSYSNKSLQSLSQLCYDASIMEGMRTVTGLDIHQQGKPWKLKRDTVRSRIKGLKPRNNIAFPPLPLGEITSLPADNFSILINGHDFVAGPYSMQGRSPGPSYSMQSVDNFLSSYPASGIISYDDAQEIASMLDSSPLGCTGLTHQGPVRSYSGISELYSDAANSAYARSSNAQLAEIRSDVVRAVYKNPMPKPGIWTQVYVYKGKVSVWYRCRDAPNSAEGYRIDWFAVSNFPVAGSEEVKTNQGHTVHLWPRQRLRSQEMELVHNVPRRLKATLFSMLEKARASRADVNDVYLAWERLATTANSATYGSGKMFITCRFLSSTLSSPSSPFDEMAKKLENPVTYADVAYLMRLDKILSSWGVRDQYSDKSPILGLPRSYSQLESYWMMWVPSQFADSHKNMAECIFGLHAEAKFLDDTMQTRINDLSAQSTLLQSEELTITAIRESLRNTCTMDTGGKMGWSWIGSLASGHALNIRGSAAAFDRRYGRGTKSRTIVDHLTVRHSARITDDNRLEKGTVAEMMVKQGIDSFLSTVDQTYRFLFINLPTFFNHPKGGEHKPREISIADPDSRVCLSDAELICGLYGKTTGVDFLKDPTKNAKFYRTAARVMTRGGGIQSSDATRYGPSMSNFAIAIMLLCLGTLSMHLKWASVVYARLAYRRMLLPTEVKPYLHKLCAHSDTQDKASEALEWMSSMDVACYENGKPIVWYTTSHHMGQGMSHHSSSLLHAGGLIIAVEAARQCEIVVSGKLVSFKDHIMVTSDDSTLLIETIPTFDGQVLNRTERQVGARIFLQLVRSIRDICLRMVSVSPNLVKEIISAVKGEFNSQDTGIGATCPILGYRELVSLIVLPSAPSLVGDYLNSFASSRDIAFAGQGLAVGCFVQLMMIDAIEERWGLNMEEKEKLMSLNILPTQLTRGCNIDELAGSPASFLPPMLRASMLKETIDANSEKEDLDPNTRDSVYSSLMHVKIAMSKQHREAIKVLKDKAHSLDLLGREHQSRLLKESLSSTLSSARSRNLGRVAFRIRNRQVTPRKYRDLEFDKNTMIESTLNWLDYLEKKLVNNRPSADDVMKGNAVSGFIKILSSQRSTFPRPPRLRRHQMPVSKKPRFVLSSYGQTPFGIHAIQRSGVSVVESIGPAERIAVQEHLALKRHRKFSEHVEYGGGFVLSWSDMSCGVIVALDITNDLSSQLTENIKLGDFSRAGINKLRKISQEYPAYPVLALHCHDGVRGLWHAVHNGVTYTVLSDYDLAVQDSDAILHQTETGSYVLLGLQGFQEEYEWSDTVPTPSEVRQYQRRDYFDQMPSLVRSVEDDNILHGNVEGATYATTLEYRGIKSLVYVAPNVTSLPRENPRLLPRVPYLRGKVVSGLSAAGYWHTSLRGVAFRAYLRGCYWGETVWTGGVIGWRLSASTIPCYHSQIEKAIGVKALIVIGGYDNVDQVSKFNPDMHSVGYKVVCESNTETYDAVFRVSDAFRDDILNANYGKRFPSGNGQGAFLSFDMEAPPPAQSLTMPDRARQNIVDRLNGQDADDGW